MPFRTDDMESARLKNPFVLGSRFLFELFVQFVVPFPDRKNFFAHVLAVAYGLLDHLILQVLVFLPERFPGHEFGIAAQQNIRAAACHIRGDRDRAEPAGLVAPPA